MSAVLDRVDEKTKGWDDPAFMEKLASKPLSKVMRRETWGDHSRAEYSNFEQALVKGTLPVEAYREVLLQSYPIYVALEERAAELKDDPIAGPIIFPELDRREKLAADLDFYYGDVNWRDLPLYDVTKEFTERVRNADPVRYVAQHYTRYLADLSGGLMIDQAIKNAYNLDRDGRRLYEFDLIEDPVEWKKNYRETLDALPIDAEGKRTLVEEVMVAYEFNIETIEILEKQYLASA